MRPRRFAQCRVAEVTEKDAKDVGPARTGSLCVAEGWGRGGGGAVKDNDQDVEDPTSGRFVHKPRPWVAPIWLSLLQQVAPEGGEQALCSKVLLSEPQN